METMKRGGTEGVSLEQDLTRIAWRTIDLEPDIAADHQFRQLGGCGLAGIKRTNCSAALNDRDSITDSSYFAQFVGNEDNRASIGHKPLEDSIEFFDFLRRQQGGGFVQDQDFAALIESAHNLNPLTQSNR